MDLVWFEVHGFKRFATPTKLNVDGKLVAIVGPNEGGKTSLLQAFEHCNDGNAICSEGPSQETTRGFCFPDDHQVIEATYFLENGDRTAIAHIPEAANVRWYSETKRVKGGQFDVRLQPRPQRDLQPRSSTLVEVNRFIEVLETPIQISEDETKRGLDLAPLCTLLSSDHQTLANEDINTIVSFADNIEAHGVNYGIQEIKHLPQLIRDLAEIESKDHPESLAKAQLRKRRPRFLRFTDADRLLESEYNINAFFKDQKSKDLKIPKIPKAIANIAAACDLDLRSLFDSRVANDDGKIESLLDTANEALKNLMDKTWSQSRVTVRLRLNQYQLHVLVGAASEQFVKIAERSDGLRQFVALLMFIAREPNLTVPPILLIDEAERHLHYDAQADLIQMFARQSVAAKVIYTTHSIGCLPEDLGTGVRLVEMVQANLSKVNNWFWDSDTPGFSRLLFGMGANTLAFIPIRFATIAEGASDFLLLPTMLRSASDARYLGFQVAPGLSSATPEELAIIDNESPRTVYLTDSDDAGRKIQHQLVSVGIAEDKIISLPEINGVGAVIEDFIASNAYVNAVNKELARSYGLGHQVSQSDVLTPNRPATLESWCHSHGIRAPSKRAVAYRLLEAIHEFPIIDESLRESLEQLCITIQDKLGTSNV